MKRVCLLLLFALAALPGDDLGVIDFPNSGAPAAQPHFIRGVLLLHNFQYPQAERAFLEAQKADPGFALAYWGEAMTFNHGLWMEQDLDKARAALGKLGATPETRLAKAPTKREKGFLGALEALYGEGTKGARDLAYMEAMRQLHQQLPEDLEVASFYSLSILSSVQGERDFRTYMRAAAIVQDVASRNPRHPGAIHYLIHSYDDPIHAPLGLPAARAYSKIAPAATHALHMPSHIFLALGMWDDVVASNEASFGASNGRGYHSLNWLAYAYLQQGRHRDAENMLVKMKQAAAKDPTPSARWYLALMRAAQVVETRQWDAAGFAVDTTGIEYSAAASDLFARGWSAVEAGQLQDAGKILVAMRTRRAPLVKIAAGPVCHQPDFSAGISPNGLRAAAVMEKQLEALIHLKRGKGPAAIALLEQATKEEDAMALDYGPPIPVKPAHELLGEALLAQGRRKEARAQFDLALARAPKRALSLRGLAQAASQP